MRVDSARQADSVSPDGRSAVDVGCTGEPWALAGRHVFYRRPPPTSTCPHPAMVCAQSPGGAAHQNPRVHHIAETRRPRCAGAWCIAGMHGSGAWGWH